jgi:arsenite efflux transporter
MSQEKQEGISFFNCYLTVWVFLCMAAGVLLGKAAPSVTAFLGI